jgi:hypothetical protein
MFYVILIINSVYFFKHYQPAGVYNEDGLFSVMWELSSQICLNKLRNSKG